MIYGVAATAANSITMPSATVTRRGMSIRVNLVVKPEVTVVMGEVVNRMVDRDAFVSDRSKPYNRGGKGLNGDAGYEVMYCDEISVID